MYKSKVKLVTATFIIFVISFLFFQNNYAINNDKFEKTNWKVVMTSDTKELKDTQEINFKVEENNKVAQGKIASGMKAKATVDIDLSENDYNTELVFSVEKDNLLDAFKIKAKVDNREYQLGDNIELNGNSIHQIILELEWNGNDDELDTKIGSTIEKISMPFNITISQVI